MDDNYASAIGRIECIVGFSGIRPVGETVEAVRELARQTAEAVEALAELRAAAGVVISDLHRANQLGPCGEVRQVAIERAIAALRAAVLGASDEF